MFHLPPPPDTNRVLKHLDSMSDEEKKQTLIDSGIINKEGHLMPQYRDLEHWEKLTYQIVWSEDDRQYVGLCKEFPSISMLSVDPHQALKDVMRVVKEITLDMIENGEDLPDVILGTDFRKPSAPQASSGYHSRPIPKGVFGESSKIREELEELEDAERLGAVIMAMCELADIYGALREVAQVRYGIAMSDLEKMADLTAKAFKDGTRK